ncbi:MAG: carbamoyltransferase HypF [Verrucomicrobiae bacterium]|nr:carbamoyltransferase HypF [Verrucomicrobiae bacterium]
MRRERSSSVAVRLRLAIRGAVQGVGFRPFVFRQATARDLAGFVRNTPRGVLLEVEGTAEAVASFRETLTKDPPPRARIQGSEMWVLAPRGAQGFVIEASEEAGERSPFVLPDIAPCADCLREIFDPENRRHRYPFTNCTNCGPRFTIIEELPYDRAKTTMRKFAMCPACRAEYENPSDRRFHAQPNACPACGPQLALWDRKKRVTVARDVALRAAAAAVREGRIVAVKGVGGFHLVCDARNDEAVRRLRKRKRREEKPFAVMVTDLAAIRALVEVSAEEARLLASPEAPIVLLRRKSSIPKDQGLATEERSGSAGHGAWGLCDAVAPRNPRLGLMLPSSPLHHLLCRELGFPLVATSGNLSDEPICADEHEAFDRLRGIADAFLVHNRSIVRHADDSLLRVVEGREMMLRRARGYAPMPLPLNPGGDRLSSPPPAPIVLGVGAHLKNAICLARGTEAIVSQHLGDMDTPESRAAFERAVRDVQRLHQTPAKQVACDLHPDYATTAFAKSFGLPVTGVQHHLAHALACLAENEVEGPALAVVWDGTGYGTDGTVWGGEFLRVEGAVWERVARLRRFRLPGGDAAAREPRRSALGLLAEIGAKSEAVERAFSEEERRVIATMLERGVNAPWTTSAGRLFDAVAAILDLRQRHAYEAQAAIELEWAAEEGAGAKAYPIRLAAPERRERNGKLRILDWQPTIEAALDDFAKRRSVAEIAAAFHAALAAGILAVARAAGERRVALTGGCFQNGFLLSLCARTLAAEGFCVLVHQRLPPNDGGIAYGQVVATARGMAEKREIRNPNPEAKEKPLLRKRGGKPIALSGTQKDVATPPE